MSTRPGCRVTARAFQTICSRANAPFRGLFVSEIRSRGAVLSDQDLGDSARIASRLRARGFDGVVTMRLVSANQSLTVQPGFGPYWGTAWGMGGAVIPETVVRIEVNAYSLANEQLVFSAMSKSVNPESAKQLISSVSKVTTDRLARDRVIAPAQAAAR